MPINNILTATARVRSVTGGLPRHGSLTVFVGWTPGPLAGGERARPYLALPSGGTPRAGNDYDVPQGCPLLRLGEEGDGASGRSSVAMGVASGGDSMDISNAEDAVAEYGRPGGGDWVAGVTYQIEWTVNWAARRMSLTIGGTLVADKPFLPIADLGEVELEICLLGVKLGSHSELFHSPRVDWGPGAGVVGMALVGPPSPNDLEFYLLLQGNDLEFR